MFQWCHTREGAGMIVADLHRCLDFFVVAGGVDPGSFCVDRAAAISARGYRMPVHPINCEFVANQIVCVPDNHTIGFRIEIDDITGMWRTSGQTLALTNREQLEAVMFTDEIPVDIVDFAAMKFVFAQMRTQKSLVIVAGNETNFLAVALVCDPEAQRVSDLPNLRLRHRAQRCKRAAQLRLTQTEQKI